jgi:glycerophosphoryl diester phosphodiesterase
MRSVIKFGLLVSVLCAAVVSAFLSAQRDEVIVRAPIETWQPNPNIMAVAHRGAAKWAPENTLAAVEKAIELGYPYIELDVRYTRDLIPVIMHDSKVDRTTNGSGLLHELTLDEVRQLDAGSWFGAEFTNERVPMLEDVLAMARGRICIIWDTKEVPNEATVALFKRYGFDRDCLLVTFGGLGQVGMQQTTVDTLLRYWPMAPLIGKARIIEDLDEQLASYPGIRAVKVNRRNVNAELVSAAHERGLLVISTALMLFDHPKFYWQLVDAGLDIIMLDHFDVLNDYLATGNVNVPAQEFPPNAGYYKDLSAEDLAERRAMLEEVSKWSLP